MPAFGHALIGVDVPLTVHNVEEALCEHIKRVRASIQDADGSTDRNSRELKLEGVGVGDVYVCGDGIVQLGLGLRLRMHVRMRVDDVCVCGNLWHDARYASQRHVLFT